MLQHLRNSAPAPAASIVWPATPDNLSTTWIAVKSQNIWFAVSVCVLIVIIKKKLNLNVTFYTLLQNLSVTIFERIGLTQAVTQTSPDLIQLLHKTSLIYFIFKPDTRVVRRWFMLQFCSSDIADHSDLKYHTVLIYHCNILILFSIPLILKHVLSPLKRQAVRSIVSRAP